MKPNATLKSMKVLGVTAFALGTFLFTSGQASAGEDKELGEKLLYKGKTHEHIVDLKELLHERDFLDIREEEINDQYDQVTKKAVRQFQEKYDLLIDGIAGVQTIAALVELEKGDEGILVETLQEDLTELGYYEHKIDGEFGPFTEKALINFHEEEDIEEKEGIAGPKTFSALHELTSRYNPDIEAENTANTAQTSNETGSSNDGQASSNQSSESSNDNSEAVMTMEATAYTAYCDGCIGITATGIDLRNQPNKKVVAVDPNVIPLGSVVEVEGYGRAIAGDTGGAIKGNRIDLHMATKDEAFSFGRQNVTVRIIETP
ncbi:peptidoglycan-binding protein [Bacillus shivajii]|uniref:peptidoglycan-binding protein n=1 Tax=Bacillus shivajii TaxID=1983719 RepID=UPI001CF99B54|nr:peptidoglycan-binding protein [Bacillus shivajii]UCZ54230.1 peptidoglycan-binding protein [Bacillus shivajii]